MRERAVRKEGQGPSINFFPEYGTYTVGDVSLVSVRSWDRALHEVWRKKFYDDIVLLPELITVAGKNISDGVQQGVEVTRAIKDLLQFSRQQASATFVVGSPHFVSGVVRPYNGAFVIRNGEILGIGHKRSGSFLEESSFTMDEAQPSLKIGDANLLICSDLVEAVSPEPDIPREQLIDPSARRLLVISCWGIGMNPLVPEDIVGTQEEINDYYQRSLQYALEQTFKNHPNIQEIFVCDRAPTSPDALKNRVATVPTSAYARR